MRKRPYYFALAMVAVFVLSCSEKDHSAEAIEIVKGCESRNNSAVKNPSGKCTVGEFIAWTEDLKKKLVEMQSAGSKMEFIGSSWGAWREEGGSYYLVVYNTKAKNIHGVLDEMDHKWRVDFKEKKIKPLNIKATVMIDLRVAYDVSAGKTSLEDLGWY